MDIIENNDLTSNKMKRKHQNNDDLYLILNRIDTYGYINMALHTMFYMKNNPFILQPGLSKRNYLIICSDYIFNMFKSFYSNCGLSYDPKEQKIDEERLEIFIETPVNSFEFNFYFLQLLSVLELNLTNAFYLIRHNWSSISCRGEGNLIWIQINLTIDNEYNYGKLLDYERELIHKYENPDSNIPI